MCMWNCHRPPSTPGSQFKMPALHPMLRQSNPLHTSFFHKHLPSAPTYNKRSLPFGGFPTKIWYQFLISPISEGVRYRSVSTVTRLRAERPGFDSRQGPELYLCTSVQTGSGAYQASHETGTRGSFMGVKRPERKAHHSPPYSFQLKNACSYTCTP
jgi:hypothetical protein